MDNLQMVQNLRNEIKQLEQEKLEMARAVVRIDNLSLEEYDYSFACDTHDHEQCNNCDVLKAEKIIEESK